MPTIHPAKSHRQGLVSFISFIDRWWASDAVRASSLPGGASLRSTLIAIVEEIDGSLFSVNQRELSTDEANALFYLSNVCAIDQARDPALPIVGLYIQNLAGQVKLLAMPDTHVSPNPLYQTTRYAKRVFLVCGRAREPMLEMERWLRSLGLEPIVLETQTVAGAQAIASALEDKVAGCGTAVVLATPDDLGRLAGGSKFSPRARQNVILELGLVWGLLGTRRIVVVMHESVVTDFPTDTAGFMTIRFKEHVNESFDRVRTKLQEMGVISVAVGS
jgi:predicted nucleotide-binding protein